MRCYIVLAICAAGSIMAACSPANSRLVAPLRVAALSSPSLPPWTTPSWEVEAVIQAGVAHTHPTCCIGVWVKNIVAAQEDGNPDGYWFKADYYELLPCQSEPSVYAAKGHCSLHDHQMHIYDMRAEVDPCPHPMCSGSQAS